MTDIAYRVVPRGKNGFDVEMDKPDGRKQTVPGFRSEHEADAWIVQAKRMIRDAGPWTPLAPRKPTPAATVEATKPGTGGANLGQRTGRVPGWRGRCFGAPCPSQTSTRTLRGAGLTGVV